MTAGHYVEQCIHGTVHGQCRCPDPSKTVRIVPCGTPCRLAAAVAQAKAEARRVDPGTVKRACVAYVDAGGHENGANRLGVEEHAMEAALLAVGIGRLEEIRRLVAWAAVDAASDRRENTHAPNCHQWHAGCLALAVNRILAST